MILQGPALHPPEQRYQTLPELFSYSFINYPDRVAFSAAGAVYTYRDINRLSRNFAAYLQYQTDLQPGDRILIQLPNIVQYAVAAIGALRAGLVLVNSSPQSTPAEMQHQFGHSGARALVLWHENIVAIAALAPATQIHYSFVVQAGDLLSLPRRWIQSVRQGWRQTTAAHWAGLNNPLSFVKALHKGGRLKYQLPALRPDQLAVLQYTAGTSGEARGVMLSHGNLLANVQQILQQFSDQLVSGKEVAIVPLPLTHIYSFTLNMLTLQAVGAHRVLIADTEDISALLNEMLRWPFTLFSGLNGLFMALCRTPGLQAVGFKALQLTISGGMALSNTVMNSWPLITGCDIVEGYGLTETSPVVAVNVPSQAQSLSVGTPLPGTEVQVMDSVGEVLPEGEAGELWVRGPQVMQGYWQDPVATEAVLRASGWLATGDIARLARNGHITLIDRKCDLIHVAGFSIYPNELESIIASHPGVLECAVIGVPDETTGEQIKAYIVPANSRLSVKVVRDYCRERLTSYKVPQQVEFCQTLPRTSIGKVQRRSLRAGVGSTAQSPAR